MQHDLEGGLYRSRLGLRLANPDLNPNPNPIPIPTPMPIPIPSPSPNPDDLKGELVPFERDA